METLLPFLEVSGPAGQQFRVELDKDRITIGRFEPFNDVALAPDPQQLITRKVHCSVERDAQGWAVVDNGSVNRTLVKRGTVREVVEGRAALTPGDSMLILGMLTEAGHPLYWELTFRDPLGTQPSEFIPVVAYLIYDSASAKLFRITGRDREEIHPLSPNEHKLIRYMDWRNRANGYVPVMCTYEDLLAAVWEEPYHSKDDVSHLVREVRMKLEPDPANPKFIETIRGLGYRLMTRPPTQKYKG